MVRVFGSTRSVICVPLADDLDAISTIVDAGVGLDVTVAFGSGTELVFDGLGTGAVSSIADLVDDPLIQLIEFDLAIV